VKRSESRILTTHAGSLPRLGQLVDLQLRKSRGETVDPAVLGEATRQATRRAVARQLECGIDVGNDGEQPRESFVTYVRYRMSGFAGESRRPPVKDLVTDCGFDTSTGFGKVAEEVVWEKLRALRAGADLATTRLF